MKRRYKTNSPALNLCKETLWNVILYFIYFFTLLFWMRLIGVSAQGNRGVIINNQKFDDSSGAQFGQTHQNSSISPNVVSSVTTKAPVFTTTTRKITTTKKSTTPGHLLGTMKSFQSQSFKNFNANYQSTSIPLYNPQSIRQQKRPQKLKPFPTHFLGIENILRRNSSDSEKLDEIFNKLNKTGSLSKVNVFNTSKNYPDIQERTPNIKYPEAAEHEPHDHQKDSKELKVQFVLDCGLKDMASTTLKKPEPTIQTSTVKKVPISYPNFPSNAFNQRVTTKPPFRLAYTQNSVVYYVPTVKTTTTPKPRIKHVYVDPPIVSEISDTFENVYNLFENALTTKVKVKPQNRKAAKKRPIKRSTIENAITPPTVAPYYRYTQSGLQNGQKLTTNIHVTSEYVGKDQDLNLKHKHHQNNDISESDSYGDGFGSYDDGDDDDDDEDDDGDDDEDDNRDDDEDDGLFDYSFGGGGESDDEDDYDESYEDERPPNKLNFPTHKKHKRTKKRKSDSESESNEYFGGFTMSNMGKYFQRTYDTISDYVPVFPSFFGSDDSEEDDDESKIRKPKLKNSLYSKSRHPNRVESSEKKSRWYEKFFFGSDDVEESTTPTTTQAPIRKVKLTTESGFFSWFGSGEVTTEKPIEATEQGWFSNLFSNGVTTTTTTVTPEPVQVTTEKSSTLDSKKWLDMLASHLATMQSPTPSTMNRTSVLKRVKYDDYQIWRIMPSTQAQLEFLREYKESDEYENVLWLKGPSMRGQNDILVPPEMNKEVQEMLEYESIPFEVVVWDLEKAIKYENPIMSRRQKIELEKEQGHPMTWYRYHNFEDIAIYLDFLQLTYPDLVELIHIGRSFEGRPLMVAKISFDATEAELMMQPKKNKPTLKTRRKKKVFRPAVFIEAGVHGREWITPAVATWILKELVKYNSTEDGNVEKELLRAVDWYIMPVSNPDGYEFSLNYDRMWRKTRSKLPEAGSVLNMALKWLKRDQSANGAGCFGTDPDRNYDVDWGKYGSSSVCSEFYAGNKAFSEPETKALASFLEENKKTISLFVSLHSYGQFIRYPSTANSTFDASQRSNDLRDVAEVAVNALRDLASSGRYTVDNTYEMSSSSAGSSTDYAMHKIGIKYSYTIELRDTGTQGFLLSPSYIDTSGLEAYEMIKAMVDYI